MKKINIEVEGGEFLMQSKEGHYAVIPAKDRKKVMNLVKDGCDNCIDNYIQSLPKESNYAEDGTLIETQPTAINSNFYKDFEAYNTNPAPSDQIRNQITSITNQQNFRVQEAEDEEKKAQEIEKLRTNFIDINANTTGKTINLDNISESSFNKYSQEDIKLIQKELVDKGYLKSENTTIDSKNKNSVSNVQTLLRKKGYDLGKYGVNKDGIDGIYGNLTKKALEHYNKNKEIDGKIGDKTKLAFKNYTLDSQKTSSSAQYNSIIANNNEHQIQTNLQREGYFGSTIGDYNLDTANIGVYTQSSKWNSNKETTCTTKECGAYVGAQIENKIKTTGREAIGAYGDAWTIHANLIGAGGTSIYNALPNKKEISTNPESYLNNKTNKKVPLTSNDLRSGDIVNMYYGGSANIRKAYREGASVWSTHLGIIKEDNNGKLFVEHNVSGKIYKEPIENLLNNTALTSGKKPKPLRITAITRPNYNIQGGTANVYTSSGTAIDFSSVANTNTSLGSKTSAQFSQTLVNNKDLFLKNIPINSGEFDNLSRAAQILGWKESNFIESGNPKTSIEDFGANARENFGGTEASKGFTQLKDEQNINSDIRAKLGITNNSLTNPSISAIATMTALSTKYLKIKESLDPSIKMTNNELAQLAIISWNEPINKVIATANKYKTLPAIRQAYNDDYGYNEKGDALFPYNLTIEAYNNYTKTR
jgi:hypothetical protein